ncbi:MAG TPA: nuclear transport factor 2 family protein [Candidatus Nanopelagicales bacterium]|nr:nuclear transport factor 2 family protein [Candidatus Nanopelagicales bacterium]
MKRWLLLAWLCLALLAGLAGCAALPPSPPRCPEPAPAPAPASPPATEAELEAVHQRLVTAYRSNDVPALERMISPDHIHNNVFGMIQGKDALLGDMRSGMLVFRAYEISSSRWFIRGDQAMVTGTLRAEAERAGKPVPSAEFRFTRVFERRDGQWQELLFHNTMVVVPPGR